MGKCIFFLIIGILSILQCLFLPIHFNICENNIYLSVVSNSSANFTLIFGCLDIILAIVHFLMRKLPEGVREDTGGGTIVNILLVMSIITLVLSTF